MYRLVIRLFMLAMLVQATASAGQNPTAQNSADPQQQLTITRNLTSMPLAFTENRGQWDDQVKFRANAGGATMWFAETGAYYQFTRSIGIEEPQAGPIDPMYELDREPEQYETMMIKASFVGANPNTQVVGLDEMEYKCNYFIGNDPNEWHTDVPNYEAIILEEVYEGIDLKYYGNGRQMEYDFVVSPGADFSQIQIQYEGAESISVNAAGELVVKTEWGEVVERKPVIYQIENDSRVAVSGEYSLKGTNAFGFELDKYNPAFPLVIDPVLEYSTYLGGTGIELAMAVVADNNGNAYVHGSSQAGVFPTLNPFQGSNMGAADVFVTKIDPEGSMLIYSTYIGGAEWDHPGAGSSIALDAAGNVYLTGNTDSPDYPTLDPYQGTNYGGTYGQDAYVTKLSSSGNNLIFSTYLGGSEDDYGTAIAVSASDNACVVGFTRSSDFPIEDPYQATHAGGTYDGFVTELGILGNSLVYSTYLGGSGNDRAEDMVLDESGNVYITGYTSSSNFPTEGPFQTYQGGGDAYVAQLAATGNALLFSTFLGGTMEDWGMGIDMDSYNNVYVAGYTLSYDFPTVNAYQSNQPSEDAFVAKINPTGENPIYSTYIGGGSVDQALCIDVTADGIAHLAGVTKSSDFPTLEPYQTDQEADDVFVVKLGAQGDVLTYSTYLGGSRTDEAHGIFVDALGYAYVVGFTTSYDFPTLNSYQETNQGGPYEAFVTKLFELSDIDGDGYTDDVDCDDSDPYTYPGAAPNDSPTECMRDADEDDFGDITATGDIVAGTDCNDSDATIYPGATEIPDDDTDQDCNGADAITCYVDADQDGYGDIAGTTAVAPDGSCDTGDGESDNMTDCIDTDNAIYPGATEIPDDGIDQDCNGFDEITCYVDSDLDGYGTDLGTSVLAPDGSCDAVDGESYNMEDCDDAEGGINPGATEIPGDGIDQNCDGEDPCCVLRVGDANGLGGDEPTIGDISTMIDVLFISANPELIACYAEADINQSGGTEPGPSDLTIGDISTLIDYLFITGPGLGLPDCL